MRAQGWSFNGIACYEPIYRRKNVRGIFWPDPGFWLPLVSQASGARGNCATNTLENRTGVEYINRDANRMTLAAN